mmetsp:Transcript_4294/g.9052  ORF Transcript_4294/g.9052 Transcript_4294/m.9052 type:complete len:232 (-) Transcript_4294:753-1448(-)
MGDCCSRGNRTRSRTWSLHREYIFPVNAREFRSSRNRGRRERDNLYFPKIFVFCSRWLWMWISFLLFLTLGLLPRSKLHKGLCRWRCYCLHCRVHYYDCVLWVNWDIPRRTTSELHLLSAPTPRNIDLPITFHAKNPWFRRWDREPTPFSASSSFHRSKFPPTLYRNQSPPTTPPSLPTRHPSPRDHDDPTPNFHRTRHAPPPIPYPTISPPLSMPRSPLRPDRHPAEKTC